MSNFVKPFFDLFQLIWYLSLVSSPLALYFLNFS